MLTETRPDGTETKPEAEPLTAGEQAEFDQIEAGLQNGDTAQDPQEPAPAPSRAPNRGQQLKSAGNFLKKYKKWFAGGGAGLGILIPIIFFLFWMMAFKNVHIKNLYVTYRWAQFNRGMNKALGAQIKAAHATEATTPGGSADGTASPTDAPDESIKKGNAAELGPDAIDPNDPAQVEAEGKRVTSLEQSVEGVSEKTLKDAGASRAVKPADGTGDTPEERARSAEEKAKANTEDDLSKNRNLGDAPESLQEGIDESKEQQENGKTPQQAAEDGAGKVLSGSSGWVRAANQIGNIFTAVSFYCIFRDIYVTAKAEVNKIAIGGAIGVAQSMNKTADCQKLGECDANQVGAVAEKYDNGEESFTETCGYTRATQSDNPGCKEIDPQFVIDGAAKTINGAAETALVTADNLFDPPFAGAAIEESCDAIMNPVSQAAQLVITGGLIYATGGSWGAVGRALGTSAAALLATAGGKALVASTIMKYTGDIYKDMNPIDMGNLNDMGNMAMASGSCATAWCPQASDAQVAQLDREYRTERIAANSKRSVLEKFFDTESPDSVTSRVVLNTPTTPKAIVGRLKTVFASITNPVRFNFALGNNSLAIAGTQTAYAADEGASAYGLSNKVTVPPNLLPGNSSYESVLAWGKGRDLSELDEAFKKCVTDTYDARVTSDDKTCFWDNLNEVHPEGKMYFQYKYHQNVAYKTALAHNNQATAGASGGGSSGGGTATAISGARAELNTRLLGNAKLKLGNYGSAATQRTDIQNGVVTDQLVRVMLAIVEQSGVALPVNAMASDHDPGTLHGAGKAVDIGYRTGDATGTTLFKFLYDNRALLKIDELIWQTAPSGTQCINGGTPGACSEIYTDGTLAQHASHIHLGTLE